MKLRTRICDILGIKYPIIQAGMAGGPTTVQLVSNVSNAGGLGTLGAAYMSPTELRAAIKEIRKRTDKPFAVNLFAAEGDESHVEDGEGQSALRIIKDLLGILPSAEIAATRNFFNEQFQVVIEEQVPVVSTAFGVLPKDKTLLAKENHIKITTMVTTVHEAKVAEESGVDIVIAQGSDAGGHRGTFDVKVKPEGAMVGTFSLIPQVADAVSIPVAAAGGIMDGRGLVAALALGAQGVQMGTAFLTMKESGAHEVYQKALLESNEESTVITRAFSGRPARGIKNEFIELFQTTETRPAQFPYQNSLTKQIRQEAAKQNNPAYMSLWAGQGTRMLKPDMAVKEFIEEMIQEARKIMW